MDKNVLATAVAAGAALHVIEGRWYAAYPYGEVGWWVSELEVGSNDYFVGKLVRGGLYCTCQAWSAERGCKHTKSIEKSIK